MARKNSCRPGPYFYSQAAIPEFLQRLRGARADRTKKPAVMNMKGVEFYSPRLLRLEIIQDSSVRIFADITVLRL